MEHDGSRAAADLSHEGDSVGSGIEVSREETSRPANYPYVVYDMCRCSIPEELATQCRSCEEAARNTALGKWGTYTASLLT